jgi:uncharacterized membrane protein YqaE (UPF0057 family)
MEYLRLLLAFVFPPIAVYMQFGRSKQFWINCLLTVLGVVPGIIHAVYVMASQPPGLVKIPQS